MQREQFSPETGSRWVGGQVSAVIWGYSDPDRAPSIFRVLKFLFFVADLELCQQRGSFFSRGQLHHTLFRLCSLLSLHHSWVFFIATVAGAKPTHSFSSSFWPLSRARCESRETCPRSFPWALPAWASLACGCTALLMSPCSSGCHLPPAPGNPRQRVQTDEPLYPAAGTQGNPWLP